MTSRTTEALMFFRAWLSAPLRVASITPSGKALSVLMTSEISRRTGTVIELGPGTGAFTQALLDQGVPEENLILVKYGFTFIAQLEGRFPLATTFQMDAAHLRKLVIPIKTPIGAVVSGLPHLSMSPRKVLAILEGAFFHLNQNGAFYQFTYGPRCPIARPLLDRLGLKAVRVGGTLANIPPAAVYRISRRSVRRASASAELDRSRGGREPALL